jgi:quinol monooxygenase YgiN
MRFDVLAPTPIVAGESNIEQAEPMISWRLVKEGSRMEMFIFARFHARSGQEGAVEEALQEVAGPSREEPGCLGLQVFRSTRDPRLFYIHSRWKDEAAFDLHAGLPHTVRFLERVAPLIDHPLDVNRTEMMDWRDGDRVAVYDSGI